MYNIPHFKANNEQEVLQFMQSHPFVLICGIAENGYPVATHVPILIKEREGKWFIQGHIMKKQDHTIAFEKHDKVLVVFSGEHYYVSAQLYNQQNTASTWNYSAVHLTGKIDFKDEDFLSQLLEELTQKFEKDKNSPSLVNKMDKSYVQSMMKAIVAFEIEVENLQHVFKKSQNKTSEEQKRIQEYFKNTPKS